MNPVFGNSIPIVLLLALFVLANAQRASNNYRDVGVHELERQNKITKQILEAFIQKKLGLKNNSYKAPSLLDILPMPTPSMVTSQEPDPEPIDPEEELQDQDESENQDSGETEQQEYNDSDSLQSVESEQIDSFYNTEGTYSYCVCQFSA